MKELDVKKIESYLDEEKYEEAKSMLYDFFNQEMPAEEKASLYLEYASLYLRVMNKINMRYNQALREIKKNLESITTFEKSATERLNLAEVRASLEG